MITRKVCLLGAFAVGKTSLMRRFVHGVFDERYLTTLGVKIDTKTVELDGKAVKLVIWDIEGAEKGALRGARRTLREMTPKLAICVYHKLDDLYAIPDLISEIQPAYRFWLDHHTIHGEETVLYADARG